MKTWTFERHPTTGDGPWVNEPDKAQWVDPATGLDCLIVRNHMGSLCGYVGVPPTHPWHSVSYGTCISPDCMVEDCMDWDHMTPERLVQVHGGLTFSNLCADGEPEDGICHTPESGRPANVWWFGFDCGHSNDLMPPTGDPRIDNLFSRLETNDLWGGRVYRDFPYVQAEVTQLAAQLAGVSG